MSAPYMHSVQTGAFLPSIYMNPEYNRRLRTAHIVFEDLYESFYKRYGIERFEMMHVMPDLSKVDVLVGTEILPYYSNTTQN